MQECFQLLEGSYFEEAVFDVKTVLLKMCVFWDLIL
jgi:hypothetical protein